MQKKKNLVTVSTAGKTKARQKQYRPPRTPEPLVGTKRGKNVSQDDRRSETQRVQQAAPANARLAALSKLRSAGTGTAAGGRSLELELQAAALRVFNCLPLARVQTEAPN